MSRECQYLLAVSLALGAVSSCKPASPPVKGGNIAATTLSDSGLSVGWGMYNLNYQGQRFSPLSLIDTANIGRLRPLCRVQLGEEGTLQAGPVVIGDTLLITTAHTTVALDATTCETIWRFVDPPVKTEVYSVNRGVAYLDGRVFRGTPDGRLVALRSDRGEMLWNVKVGNPGVGSF